MILSLTALTRTTIVAALSGMIFLSCSSRSGDANARSQPVQAMPTTAAPPAQPAAGGVAGAGALNHYICPNGCEGSGSTLQGVCPTCGTAYVHNAAYHNQGNAAPRLPSANPGLSSVYHYICDNGCAGGSDDPGNCATCGAALAHNQAYHNQAPQNEPDALSPLFLKKDQPAQQPATAVNPDVPGLPAPIAGVYHYVCNNGCAGGSNTKGYCASCGAALTHNQAYHQ